MEDYLELLMYKLGLLGTLCGYYSHEFYVFDDVLYVCFNFLVKSCHIVTLQMYMFCLCVCHPLNFVHISSIYSVCTVQFT